VKISSISGLAAAAALGAGLGAFGAASAASNLLTNGGFEQPSINLAFYSAGSTAITGFTVVGLPGGDSTAALVNNSAFGGLGVRSSEGAQFVDLTGEVGRGAGVRSDDFATQFGATYAVTFDVGAFFVGGYGSYGNATVELFVNGVQAGSFQNILSLSTAGSDYQTFSHSFTGTGAATNVAFYSSQSQTSSNLGVGLDNVGVTMTAAPPPGSVPEPTTWALMISGFGIAGAMLRRKARQPA
jgi:hypothetical protein